MNNYLKFTLKVSICLCIFDNYSCFAKSEYTFNDLFFNKLALEKTSFKAISPLYKNSRFFEGYKFNDVLSKINYNKENDDVVTFIAKDNFKISIPIFIIKKYHPFLAAKDLSIKNSHNWEKVRDGGRILDGGPYYLMWNNQDSLSDEYWVFGVTKIKLTNYKEAYGNSAPLHTSNEKILQGFQVYQRTCSACHSMNLSGGTLGVEMNVPQNFTEYYSEKHIINYAKLPSAYRANAKMPPVKLTESEANQFLAYLKYMKGIKICKNDAECQKLMDENSRTQLKEDSINTNHK